MRRYSPILIAMKTLTLAICLLYFCIAMPSAAYADINPTIDACAQQDPNFDSNPSDYTPYTAEIVSCVDAAVRTATFNMMDAISQYMAPVVGACMVIAVIVLGIRIASGEPYMLNKTGGFLIRLALVLVFSYDLDGFADAIFDGVDQFAYWGSGGTPWREIDIFLNRIFGFAPNLAVYQGLIGMIGMELFSSSIGAFMFAITLVILLQILLFIFRVVYTYISAIVIVAFMIIISPIVISTAMFYSQEKYFRKWVDVTLSASLTPMIMFACIGLFVNVFNNDADRIFTILGSTTNDPQTGYVSNPDLSPYWKINQHAFSMLMPTDPGAARKNQLNADVNQQNEAAVQTNITSTFSGAVDAGSNFSFHGIDLGPDNTDILQRLVIAFLPLWIFASLMQKMLELVPELCSNIAGAASGVIWQATNFEEKAKKLFSANPKDLTELRMRVNAAKSRLTTVPDGKGGSMFSKESVSSFFGNISDTFSKFGNKD